MTSFKYPDYQHKECLGLILTGGVRDSGGEPVILVRVRDCGGSPLIYQGEPGFSPAKTRALAQRALAQGIRLRQSPRTAELNPQEMKNRIQ